MPGPEGAIGIEGSQGCKEYTFSFIFASSKRVPGDDVVRKGVGTTREGCTHFYDIQSIRETLLDLLIYEAQPGLFEYVFPSLI